MPHRGCVCCNMVVTATMWYYSLTLCTEVRENNVKCCQLPGDLSQSCEPFLKVGWKKPTWKEPLHICDCFTHLAVTLILFAVCFGLLQALLTVIQLLLQVIPLSPVHPTTWVCGAASPQVTCKVFSLMQSIWRLMCCLAGLQRMGTVLLLYADAPCCHG